MTVSGDGGNPTAREETPAPRLLRLQDELACATSYNGRILVPVNRLVDEGGCFEMLEKPRIYDESSEVVRTDANPNPRLEQGPDPGRNFCCLGISQTGDGSLENAFIQRGKALRSRRAIEPEQLPGLQVLRYFGHFPGVNGPSAGYFARYPIALRAITHVSH